MAEPTLADWGELRFLRWVRSHFGIQQPQIPISIGDDAAHLRLESRDLIVTNDALIEGVHFERKWTPPRNLGSKALVSNLSDVAAMAARPVAAFLSLGVPSSTSISELRSFFSGLQREAAYWDCTLAGGDLVRAPQWSINIMVVGEPSLKGRVVRRSAARTGQKLYVTGVPGKSAGGLQALRRGDNQPHLVRRHNRPTPRIPEAHALARCCKDLALIDVSDGVLNEARHLSEESGIGIEINMDALPASKPLGKYFDSIGMIAAQAILFGGEDYELLFTTSKSIEALRAAFQGSKIKTRITEIGRVVAGSGVRVVDASGKRLRIKDQTFKHFV